MTDLLASSKEIDKVGTDKPAPDPEDEEYMVVHDSKWGDPMYEVARCISNIFDSVGDKDDIFALSHEMAESFGLVKNIHPLCWRMIFIADLVSDADLLHPEYAGMYADWRQEVVSGSKSLEDELYHLFDKISRLKVRFPPPHRAGRLAWVEPVLSVFPCFHLVDLRQKGEKRDEVLVNCEKVMIEGAKMRGNPQFAQANSGNLLTGSLNNVPDYRFCYMFDFAVKFKEKGKTVVLGVAQLPVNHRCGRPFVFDKMEEAFVKGKNSDILEGKFMFPENKSMMLYRPSCPEVGDEIVRHPKELRVLGALLTELVVTDPTVSCEVYGQQIAGSIIAGDVLDYGLLWCGEAGMAEQLENAGYSLSRHSGGSLILKKGTEQVDMGDDSPSKILDMLLAGFQGGTFQKAITPSNLGDMASTMVYRYLRKKHLLHPPGDLLTGDDEKEALAKLGRGVTHESSPGDYSGLIWLLNLASHRVRIGCGSGRHRLIQQLMTASGCGFLGKHTLNPPFHKRTLIRLHIQHCYLVYQQMNACNSTKITIAPQDLMVTASKMEWSHSKQVDTMSDKKETNRFLASLKSIVARVVLELQHIPGFQVTHEKYDCFMDPRIYSHVFDFVHDLDPYTFNVSDWKKHEHGVLAGRKQFEPILSGTALEQAEFFCTGILQDMRRSLTIIGAYNFTLPSNQFLSLASAIAEKQDNTFPLRGRTEAQFRFISGERLELVNSLIHPDFRDLFSDEVLEGLQEGGSYSVGVGSNPDSQRYKAEEIVHFSILACLADHLIKDETIRASWNLGYRSFIGACSRSLLTGTISTGTGARKNYKKKDRKSHLPDTIQLMFSFFTILLTMPGGSLLLSRCFFCDRKEQRAQLLNVYMTPLFSDTGLSAGDIFRGRPETVSTSGLHGGFCFCFCGRNTSSTRIVF